MTTRQILRKIPGLPLRERTKATIQLKTELDKIIAEKRKSETAFLRVPQRLSAEDAKKLGIDLQPGWGVKVTPGKTPTLTYISPDKEEIPEGELYTFEGKWISKRQADELRAAQPRLTPEQERIRGALIEDWGSLEAIPEEELRMAYPADVIEQFREAELGKVFGEVFPGEETYTGLLQWVNENPEEFLGTLQETGRTPEAEELLNRLYSDITPEEMGELFGEPLGGAPAITEEEGWIKDNIIDPLYLGGVQFLHGIKQTVTSLLPSIFPATESPEAFKARWDEFVAREGRKPTALEVQGWQQELKATATRSAQEQYIRYTDEHEKWIAKHPELAPKPEYELNPFEQTELFKDPGYYAHTISSSIAYSLSVMGTIASVTAATGGNVIAGIVAGMGIAGAPEADAMTKELLDMGVPFEAARDWGFLYGAVVGGVESITNLPLIGILFKPVKQATKPFWDTLLNITKNRILKSVIVGAVIPSVEGIEEVVTQGAHNAILKHYDETQSSLEGLDEAFIKGVIASLPFAFVGGTASFRAFKKALPAETQTEFDNLMTKFEETGVTEEQAQVMAANEIAKTTEGEKIIGDAIDAVKKEVPVAPEVTEKTWYHGARTRYMGKPRGDIAYVSESKYTAEMYGQNIREFTISPKAKILKYDNLPKEIRHTVVAKEKKSIEYAKQEGYDGVEVLQNNKINVAIWNKDVLLALTPPAVGGAKVNEAIPIAEKWEKAKVRNSTLAQKDLDNLKAKGYEIDDAQDALTTFKETVRADFDTAEEFSEARTDAWDEFVNAVDSIEGLETAIPKAPAVEGVPVAPEVTDIASRYDIAGDIVDGRTIKLPIPNQASIEASLEEYEILPNIREVPMSEFPEAAEVKERTELANEIEKSGEITPLIVVMDNEGAYILEGANRFDALVTLGAKSFPAQVVIDRRLVPKGKVATTTPPAVEAVKEVEEAPEREIYQEGGVPISPDEIIPQGIVENIPILKDVGAKELARPTRKVFERLGLHTLFKGIQRAEVEIGEARTEFAKNLKAVSKWVNKNRRHIVFRELENPGSQVGLTFNEKRAVTFFKKNFDKWADTLNLSQEKRIKNYVTHIFEEDIAQTLKAKYPLDPAIAMALEYKVPKTVFNPFLQTRLGLTVGLIEDPFTASSAYEARQLKVLYYEPFIQKIAVIANDVRIPRSTREYLKDFSRRMTGEVSQIDVKMNTTMREFAGVIGKLPGGENLAKILTRGNPSGWAAYNLTSVLYTLWLGFKPTSAIRNLSQHTLIIGEVGPLHFADGIRLRLTKEGKSALDDSLVWRSRRAAFVPGIDDSFTSRWTDKFRETALWMFRAADAQNVKDAFLAGYSEAKSILPTADRQVWIDRGDEVAADTQFLYTKMNSMALSQTSIGRVFSVLTTWTANWMELMTKWVSKRPSQVYLKYAKETFRAVPVKNWSQSYKAILMYMAIVGLGYVIKERERLKAWEYTGITSIRYLADVAGGDFPGLQAPGATANIIAGFLTDDERRLKTGWAEFKGTFTPGIVRQIEDVASGEKDWMTLLFYLEGRDFYIKQLKNKWEKGWKDYEALETSKERNKYREDNPLIEAQMFVTSKVTTLSTDEARQEVLRIIETNNLDTELIDGYEKVFGVDTNEEFDTARKTLGTVELDEKGEQKVKKNGDLDYYTTSDFASYVNERERIIGRTKIEQDGNELAIEYLRAKDLFVQYESLTEEDARTLFRQQYPDVEAQLYLWGKISTFKNPKSADILLGLMEKYNISPESIPAFLDNPEKYDELFTQRFEIKKKWFDLEAEYENYGNPESATYIEDDDLRKEAMAKLKEDNPEWVADMRRIEAIDHDVPDKLDGMLGTDAWADRGKTIDKYGAGSSEAKTWLLDHPDTHTWAIEQKLLEDDGGDWDERVLRINANWSKEDEKYNSFDNNEDRLAYLDKKKEYHEARRRRDAYQMGLPEKYSDPKAKGNPIDDYVKYYTDSPQKADDPWFDDNPDETFYGDDWWLQEHPDFEKAMVQLYKDTDGKTGWKKLRDFSKVPTKKVFELYKRWKETPLGQERRDFETKHVELDIWLNKKFGTKLESERLLQAPMEEEELKTAEELLEWARSLPEDQMVGVLENFSISLNAKPEDLSEKQLRGLREVFDNRREFQKYAEGQYIQRVKGLLEDAENLGILKGLGISSDVDPQSISEADVNRLAEAVAVAQRKELIEYTKPLLTRAQNEWFEQWGVPEKEREAWKKHLLTIAPVDYKYAGGYIKVQKGIEIPEIKIKETRPGVLAHEFAHANYFENIPDEMLKYYPVAHALAQAISPMYLEAVETYPGGAEKGRLPVEGYAQAYRELAKGKEKLPWYLEPFYGNLLFEVPDLPKDWEKSAVAWLAYWTRYKLEEALGNLLK